MAKGEDLKPDTFFYGVLNEDSTEYTIVAVTGVSGALGANAVVVGVVNALGFTSAGVAANSFAASVMIPAVVRGSTFAILQSIGASGIAATGLGSAVVVLTGGALAAGGAYLVYEGVKKYGPELGREFEWGSDASQKFSEIVAKMQDLAASSADTVASQIADLQLPSIEEIGKKIPSIEDIGKSIPSVEDLRQVAAENLPKVKEFANSAADAVKNQMASLEVNKIAEKLPSMNRMKEVLRTKL